MRRLLNQMRLQAQMSNEYANPTIGVVSSYDSDNYCCKITIYPDDEVTGEKAVVSGWIPVGTIWSGNEWGVFCPPSIGDLVEVDFHESNFDSGHCDWRYYTDENRPVKAESGVFYIIHKSGSSLKFENDGKVSLNSAGTLDVTSSQINLNGYVKTSNHVEIATGKNAVVNAGGKALIFKNGILVGAS